MRIAQVAPLYESVPPRLYGGTERVVSYLVEELVRQGHEVTLFASGDSTTRARLIAPCARSLRLDPACVDRLAPHVLMLELVYRRRDEFDLIHSHVDYLDYSLARRHAVPHVTTLHGRLDVPGLASLYDEFRELPVVAISDAQRRMLPQANWQGTVHHGLPPDLLRPGRGRGGYLAFLGRISPEKRVDRAAEIAARSGIPLRIAAKVDPADRQYFAEVVRPLFGRPGIEYLGEIGEAEKAEFLGGARALLFPIDWPEPFGLVMVEALACGTPVVAFRGGSVAEVIEDGVSGFVVDSVPDAVAAVRAVDRISRAACRAAFEARFGVERMARDYLGIYARLVEGDGARRCA
ncbi:MAG TPA: glycosyltransferase family 4 protein [Candidatus Binatia bacterium]|nr:glycosyltransferase family 4 protein [Candidatus Binatia bacterium]